MLIFVYYTEAIYIRAEESILDIYYSPCIFFFSLHKSPDGDK